MNSGNADREPVNGGPIAYEQFQTSRVLVRSFFGVFANWKHILLMFLLVMVSNMVFAFPFMFFEPMQENEEIPTAVLLFFMLFSIIQFVFVCVITDLVTYNHIKGKLVPFREALIRSIKVVLPISLICVLYIIAYYIGSILFIIPGVIIWVGWAIVGPIYLHEDTKLFDTFGRSWELTNGYKWWVWLSMILMKIIMFIGILIVALLLGALFHVSLATYDQPSSLVGSLVMSNLFSLCLCLLFSFYAAFTSAIYAEVVELKEGIHNGSMLGGID